MAVDTLNGDRKRRFLPASVRELARGTVPLLLALGLLNASNYIFHVAISRLLGPTEYGALAALLAVVLVLSVPLSVAQTVIAKRIAILRAEGREDETDAAVAATARAMIGVGVVGFVVLGLASPLLAWFLHTEAGPAALLGPYWLLSLVLSVPLGVLQGRLRFGWLGGVAVAGVAVRLAAGIGLVWAGAGVAGAMLGTVLAQGASLLLGMLILRIDRSIWREARASLATLRGEFGPALLALGSFWLLAELDVILVRRFLEGHAAGLYASAGLLGRSLLFLPGAISMVALPRFAEARDGDEAHRRLRLALLAIGGLVAAAYPLLVILREPLVNLAFGDDFGPAAGLLPLLASGMAFMAVISLLVFFHIAEGTRAHRLIFAAIAVEAVLIAFWHENGMQVGWTVLGVSVITAGVLYHAAVAACRWRPPLDQGDGLKESALHAEPSLDLTVVLPCHNAGRGLRGFLNDLQRHLESVDSWEIVIVSDGSTDDTVDIAEEFASERVRVVHEPVRVGKGHALRMGMTLARGRYVTFMDADGDIDPGAIRPFLALMELYEPDAVLGSKRHPLSEVQYPMTRRILSWIYHKICRVLFRVNVRDTQTGLKVIRREVLAAVLPRMLEKRYAFDLEFLVVARRLGYTRVFEAPIKLDYRFDSQVQPAAAFAILRDTLAIFYRRYILNTYRLPEPGQVGTKLNGASRNGQLRILFLNWRDIRNRDAGGAEVVTHEVAKRWVQQGHQVALLTSGFKGAPKAETIDGVRIRRVGRLRRGTFHLRVQWELARLKGYDIIIDEINTIPFLTPLWRRRLPPTIALIHQLAADVWDAEVPRSMAAIGRWIEPRLLRTYRRTPVITISESTKSDLVRIGLPNVKVIPNGRDEPPDVEQVQKEPVPTFLFVGRLAKNKRPDHAIEAFRLIRQELPTARLWIVGEGPLTERLRATLPEGASMLGHLSRDELYRRMARAHCLLVPSVREGWGLVVIEANSVATPAVGYNVPGIRESVEEGVSGILAQAQSPAALKKAALELLSDPVAYLRISQNASVRAQRYSWDITAAALLAEAQGVVNAKVMGPGRAKSGELVPL